MTIIDKGGLRCYANNENRIVRIGIMEYTDFEKSILEENQNDIKEIYYESPYCFVDFSMLEKMKNLEALRIDVRNKIFDISPVNDLKKLKRFVSGKFKGILNNKNIEHVGYTWQNNTDISKCSSIESIFITNCKDMNLFIQQIIELKQLHYITFFRISSSSFPKIDKGTTVKELEFSYCPNLKDLEELSSIFPMLVKLQFDHCKNIQDYSYLSKLNDLEELVIVDSAPIKDLSFLKELKKLSELRIVKTQITAKNIEILDDIHARVNLALTGI